MVKNLFNIFQTKKSHFLFSEYIEKSLSEQIIRRHFGKNNKQILSKQSNTLSRIAFWGVTITVGGLAIYLWNQSQSMDPNKFMNLGDFLSQWYR
jgi:hypothetical protein